MVPSVKPDDFERFEVEITFPVRPESKPQMSGLKPEYTTDEVIDVVCTSKRSYPAAKIVFFVNDEPVRF